MFLIEYCRGDFINADLIEEVFITSRDLQFSIHGNSSCPVNVDDEYKANFINQLEAINQNKHSISNFFLRPNQAKPD